MLDESLDNFLEIALNSEQYKLYVDIISYLESIEYATIQDELLNFMYMSMGDENEKLPKPESMVCDEFYGHLRECLISQLSQSGVVAEEHCELRDVYDLAVGLLHISGHEDIAGIIACASMDEAPIHQLAEILQLVTTVSADHWLVFIESVQPEVIRRILEMSKQTVDSEYQEMEDTADYLQKLRLYAEWSSKTEESLETLKLVEHVMLGKPFDAYLKTNILHDLFEGDEMDKLAKELYCMALMSSDARQDPVGSIRTIVEQYIEDTRRIVQLNSEVQLVNAEFVKFFQTTSKGLSNQHG